jgi:stage V sporulation protein B
MGSSKRNNSFLRQGSVLAVSGIIVRLIGLLYRVEMRNIIGDEGIGLYGVAFEAYGLVLIISSYSLPLAVSKMVSARTINHEYRNAQKIFRGALALAITSGGIAASAIYFGADFLEKNVYNGFKPGVALPLKVLAFAIFILAIIGVLRGYFQGKNTMMPTAISQILEQIVNALVSIGAALGLMKVYSDSSKVYAWGAAGGTMGTVMGALTALLFLIFVFFLYRPINRMQIIRDTTLYEESYKDIFKILILTIIPVILSQTVYNLSGTVDNVLFGKIMGSKGSITKAYGIYNGQYHLLINVPIAIATSMAAAMIPSIVGSLAQRAYAEVRGKVHAAIKFNMLIAFPSAVGLTVLGEPIVRMLFRGTDYNLSGNLFRLGSVAIVFFALSTITSGVLQSINQMKLPVIHAAISLGIHIVLVAILLKFTDLGIYALVIGNVTFPMVVCYLNGKTVAKYLKYKQEIKQTFIIPLCCSIFMGVIAHFSYKGIQGLLDINMISTLLSIVIAVIVYFTAMIVTKGITKDELYGFPFGRTIVRIAKKVHLL